MTDSNAGGEESDWDMSEVRVDEQQAGERLLRSMLCPPVVTSAIHVQPAAYESDVSVSANRRANSGPANGGATDMPVRPDEQQMVSGHGVHSRSPGQRRSHGLSEKTTAGSQRGAERCDGDGHTQSGHGSRSVYDAVKSQPQEMVIQSVVEKCASEWYRVGIGLGYSHGLIQDLTSNKPTSEGKLQVIIERRSEQDGKEKAVEALLDVCDQIIPLAVVGVMEDLGIKYVSTVCDSSLYKVGKEVGRDWKRVARHLGLTTQEINNIKMKAKSSRKRAWKMLQLLHSKRKGDISGDEIRITLQQIRNMKQTKSQIFPENLHIDKRVCGRQSELEEIATEFWGQTDDKETPTEIPKYCLQVVNGMGGIGKSAVSEKYATEWKKKYGDGIFHFNAESLSALHISIRGNLRSLSLESAGGGVFDDNKIFLQYVYSKDKVLLLYDGADDLDLLESTLPRDSAHVHVLVTTRMSEDHAILKRADRITPLGRLGPDAGVEALQAWRGHVGEDLDAQEMNFAKLLVSDSPIQGLPLAIAHVATLMRTTGVSCQQYYQLFKAQQAELEALALDLDKLLHYFRISSLKEPLMCHGVSKPNHLSRLSTEDLQSITVIQNEKYLLSMARHFVMNTSQVHLTWQLDIETVKDTDKNAMNLLSYISLMSCRNIPERVMRPLLLSDASAFRYRMAVSTLRSHTLVDVSDSNEGCSLHIHPLVQSTLLERVMRQPEELHYRLNRMAHSLLRLLPHSDDHIQCCLGDDQFLALIPHVYAVAEKSIWISDDETCAYFVHLACMIAYLSQHIDVAAYLCNERLKATAVSTDNWQRLLALFNMGRACELMVNPQAAQLHFVEALRLIENSSNDDKSRMEHYYQLVLDRLAKCYADQQMFTEADGLYEKLLALLKERPEENRQGIATVLHNLALNHSYRGKIETAIELYEEVVEMKARDPRTPPLSLSISYLNLGDCVMENGQFEKALPLLEISLASMRENLPGDHLDMANALRRLSSCCEELGDMQRAVQLAEESVLIACHCLANNHPHIAMYMSQLASCHRRAGRLDEAIQLIKQCIEICRQSLPSTRKELCAYLNNLGQYFKENGMLDQAIETFEECLAVGRSFLPLDHSNIGMPLWNLGGAYKERNDVVKATELWTECLSIFEKCLSATHPHLLEVLLALGEIAFHQGRYYESLQMYGRAREILGTTSPKSEKMATVCDNMGVCHVMLSKLDAAEEALSQSLRIYTTIFRPGHIRISSTQQGLLKVRQLKFEQR